MKNIERRAQIALILSASVYLGLISFIDSAETVRTALISASVAQMVSSVMVGSWVALGISVSNRRPITDQTLALLAIEPIVVAAASITNGWHGFVWSNVDTLIGTSADGSSNLIGISIDPGIGFYVHAIYLLCGLLFGAFLIVRTTPEQGPSVSSMLVRVGGILPILSILLYGADLIRYAAPAALYHPQIPTPLDTVIAAFDVTGPLTPLFSTVMLISGIIIIVGRSRFNLG